jgi:hypothetical protein
MVQPTTEPSSKTFEPRVNNPDVQLAERQLATLQSEAAHPGQSNHDLGFQIWACSAPSWPQSKQGIV